MGRDIDPSLFEIDLTWENESTRNKRRSMSESVEESFPHQNTITNESLNEQKYFERLRSRIEKIEISIEKVAAKFEEFSKICQLKFERLAQGLGRVDDVISKQNSDFGTKYAQLSGRVSERKLSENKIEDMIDRHNQIITSFEQRMTQLQKVLSEQELQLANYSSALDEARQVISRMKRV